MSKKKYALILIYLICIISISFYIFLLFDIPAKVSITRDTGSIINVDFPFNIYIRGDEDSSIKINGKSITEKLVKVDTGSPITVSGNKVGKSVINFKLFGLIPIRTVKVNVIPDIKVVPGGQAIGVLLRSRGVMVVGSSFVNSIDGKYYPAKKAGIEVGDTILQINGQEIYDKVKLASVIQKVARKKQQIPMIIKKQRGTIKKTQVSPVKNKDGIFMIGLYVDDGVAGVGTLTFYKPETKEYGALGHVITENNSGIRIDVRKGQIVKANISGINYGKKGIPGEKRGTFYSVKNVMGSISKNTNYGIYGKLNKIPENPNFIEPIPVATISQVKRGPAKIYTVLKGGEVKKFDIKIDKVYRQSTPDSRGLVITVTDPDLKKITGGIIQGMSGSPIIQNNKLVGAVTHVFINNPMKGYGVFAEWMLLETRLYEKTLNKKAS